MGGQGEEAVQKSVENVDNSVFLQLLNEIM